VAKLARGEGHFAIEQATGERDWRNTVAAWLALKRSGIGDVVDDVRASIRKQGEPSYWAMQCAGADPQAELADALFEAALDTEDPVRAELAQRALRAYGEQRDAIRNRYVKTFVDAGQRTEGLRAAVRGVGGPDGRIDFLGIRVARMLVIP